MTVQGIKIFADTVQHTLTHVAFVGRDVDIPNIVLEPFEVRALENELTRITRCWESDYGRTPEPSQMVSGG